MSNNKKNSEIRELNKMFFGAPTLETSDTPPAEPPYLPPYLNTLPNCYPGVPDPYYYSWERTDIYTKHTADHEALLNRTDTALQQAREVCQSLHQRKKPMTVHDLHTIKTTVLHALHSLDEVLTTLTLNYPLPNKTAYSLIAENSDLKKFAPELLLNTQERILIRLPAMPRKSRATSSHLYHEFIGLLRANRFSSFPYWHCDFIHVYHPENIRGIKDVDNYPYKPIIDALARSLTTKDSNTHFSCGMYNHVSETTKPGSYIVIYKLDEKVRFFQDFEELANSSFEGKKDRPIPVLLNQPIPVRDSEN